MRASDGGDLVRLTPRNGTNPNYSPDGTQVVFQGVQGPQGACIPHSPPGGGGFTCPPGTYRIGESDGSVFVVNADGSGLHRIASQSGELPSWSPDGRWILLGTTLNDVGFSVVHPDGTGLQKITLEVGSGTASGTLPIMVSRRYALRVRRTGLRWAQPLHGTNRWHRCRADHPHARHLLPQPRLGNERRLTR